MREINLAHACAMPPHTFGALRQTAGFDAYFAELDGQTYRLVSETVTTERGVHKVHRVCTLEHTENPVPVGLRALLATLGISDNFPFVIRSSFYVGFQDREHPYSYSTHLPVLTDRIQIRGEQWAEPRPGGSRLVSLLRVDVQILGLGSRLERAIEAELRSAYQLQPTRALAFLESRQGLGAVAGAYHSLSFAPAGSTPSGVLNGTHRVPDEHEASRDDGTSPASVRYASAARAPPAASADGGPAGSAEPDDAPALSEQLAHGLVRCLAPAIVERASRAESASAALHAQLLRHREQRKLLERREAELDAATAQLHAAGKPLDGSLVVPAPGPGADAPLRRELQRLQQELEDAQRLLVLEQTACEEKLATLAEYAAAACERAEAAEQRAAAAEQRAAAAEQRAARAEAALSQRDVRLHDIASQAVQAAQAAERLSLGGTSPREAVESTTTACVLRTPA